MKICRPGSNKFLFPFPDSLTKSSRGNFIDGRKAAAAPSSTETNVVASFERRATHCDALWRNATLMSHLSAAFNFLFQFTSLDEKTLNTEQVHLFYNRKNWKKFVFEVAKSVLRVTFTLSDMILNRRICKMSSNLSSVSTKCRWAYDVTRWEPTQDDWSRSLRNIQPGRVFLDSSKIVLAAFFSKILKIKLVLRNRGYISDNWCSFLLTAHLFIHEEDWQHVGALWQLP